MGYYHKVVCHAEKLIYYLQCQGHSKDLYNQNMTISTIYPKLLVRLQPNFVLEDIIISWSVLCKNRVTAFKVKVTAKVQNVCECLDDVF